VEIYEIVGEIEIYTELKKHGENVRLSAVEICCKEVNEIEKMISNFSTIPDSLY
jgi:hypothetical protein